MRRQYENGIMPGVRIDKWLWAARFFKTRSLASRACEMGRVAAGDQRVKPAREVHVGDMLKITNGSGDFKIEVLILSELRGPAPVAQTLYRETEASREARLRVAAERRLMPAAQPVAASKPSKRHRRQMERLRGRI
jgi:ribosome-associated heat shock protein Hsp15